MYQILTQNAASITELKNNPMKLIEEAGDVPIAILNRNKPAFYCLSPDRYEALMDMIDDIELAALVREGDERISVAWEDLITASPDKTDANL